MNNFNFKKSEIFQALNLKKNPLFGWAGFFKKLFLVLFIPVSFYFLYRFIFEDFTTKITKELFGASVVFLALYSMFLYLECFFNFKIKNPRLGLPGPGGSALPINEAAENPDDYNLAEFLSFELAEAVEESLNTAKSRKIKEADSSILFYSLLASEQKLRFVFSRLLLDKKEIKSILESHFRMRKDKGVKTAVFSEDFRNIILESLKIAKAKGHRRIESGDVITALAINDLVFKKILFDANLKAVDIENLIWWWESLEKRLEEGKKFWEWKNLVRGGSLAKEWTAGYTLTLDRFSTDFSDAIKRQGFPKIIGHQKEIEAIERILSRKESNNNVLIVGEEGIGRSNIVYALAKRSILGESLPEINYKRVVLLDLPLLLAQIETVDEVESVLDAIFREAVSAGNVILVIDNFHNYIGLSGSHRPGAIDISGIISNYLSLVSFQTVAITTYEGLHKNIEQNPTILSLFEKVEVSEISEREALMILENLALSLEHRYKIFVSYPALSEIITLCSKYFPGIPFPEKATDLLSEAISYASQRKEKVLLPEHIEKIVSEKTQIPVGKVEIKEREILLNLEDLIHQRIINQEEAVKEISDALRRSRAEISVRKGPMGTFLFLGPTGVGKTETSKALAEIYFHSENKMIRLDMSEFQSVEDIPRLIGSAGQEGLLTTPVREDPFSLVLLDEFEKAHPNILNLFLQVLDEGHITDGMGRKVDFKNTLIIATSNAGYQIILEALKKKTKWAKVKEKILDFIFKQGIFRPELINRFDGTVVFKPLTKSNLLEIADLLLKKIKKNLSDKEIEFVITEPLKKKIVEISYDPTFGARNMQRTIQDKVGNVLATAILSGQLKRGSRAELDPRDFKLKINQ